MKTFVKALPLVGAGFGITVGIYKIREGQLRKKLAKLEAEQFKLRVAAQAMSIIFEGEESKYQSIVDKKYLEKRV